MDKIGIIGCGVVGDAVKAGMSPCFEVLTYDKHKNSTCESIYDLAQQVDGPIFVCVPTPMNDDGSCDISIVDSVVFEVNEAAKYTYDYPVVAIKSTVIPGTTTALSNKYPYIDLCFNPEFLTERNAEEDFKNQNRIIIAGDPNACIVTGDCYSEAFPDITQQHSHVSEEAEMSKYIINVHLAVKVALANEFKQICDAMSIDYKMALMMALFDERLGKSHWKVPGPDGKLGFGGTCFPKDLNALVYKAGKLEVSTPVMSGTWKKNLEVR